MVGGSFTGSEYGMFDGVVEPEGLEFCSLTVLWRFTVLALAGATKDNGKAARNPAVANATNAFKRRLYARRVERNTFIRPHSLDGQAKHSCPLVRDVVGLPSAAGEDCPRQ